MSYGNKKDLTVVHKKETVELRVGDSSEIIYTKNDTDFHRNSVENGLMDKFSSFYLVNNTRYIESKIFKVDNKEFCVSAFSFRLNSSEVAYYVPEFGFLMRYRHEAYRFKRLVKIESNDKTENELALKLVDKILADTMYSFYPIIPYPQISDAFRENALRRVK